MSAARVEVNEGLTMELDKALSAVDKSEVRKATKRQQSAKEKQMIAEKAKEEGKRELATELMSQQHQKKMEEQFQAEAAMPKPKAAPRGRPPKAAAPPPGPQFTVGTNAPSDASFTDEGKRVKGKVIKICRRLPHKTQGVVLPGVDSDEAWFSAMSELQNMLGEAAAEMNVKGVFLGLIKMYEDFSMRGHLNPAGWNTGGLTQSVMANGELFNDDLVELSIMYEEYFTSGPLLRLLGNTGRIIVSVDKQNKAQTTAAAQRPIDPEVAEKHKQL